MAIGSLILWLLGLMVLIVLNGIFVASEYSLIALRRSRVEEMLNDGKPQAKTIHALQSEIDKSIAGAQLGITFASLLAGWILDKVIPPIVHLVFGAGGFTVPFGLAYVFAFLVLSMTHVIIGEQMPKTLTLRMPESIATALARPFRLFCLAATPLIFVMNAIAGVMLKLLGLEKAPADEHPLPSPDELQILIEESGKAGTLGKQESDILTRALDLKAVTVRECMVPRTRIDAIPDTATLAEVMAVIVRTKHSKLPVYKNTKDNVVGILNSRDLFELWNAILKASPPQSVDASQSKAPVADLVTTPAMKAAISDVRAFRLSSYVRRPFFVPETTTASSLLDQMRQKKLQMAIVTDEFGATVGLLTIEDRVEQLVGEIWDEYDTPTNGFEPLADGAFKVSGEVTVFEFNKTLGTELGCQQHCTTIAGVVIEALNHQPETGETVEIDGIKFTVLEMRGRAIAFLDVRRVVAAPDPGATESGAPQTPQQ